MDETEGKRWDGRQWVDDTDAPAPPPSMPRPAAFRLPDSPVAGAALATTAPPFVTLNRFGANLGKPRYVDPFAASGLESEPDAVEAVAPAPFLPAFPQTSLGPSFPGVGSFPQPQILAPKPFILSNTPSVPATEQAAEADKPSEPNLVPEGDEGGDSDSKFARVLRQKLATMSKQLAAATTRSQHLEAELAKQAAPGPVKAEPARVVAETAELDRLRKIAENLARKLKSMVHSSTRAYWLTT